MRVLWFTTSPSLASEYLNYRNVGCSWIQSLENELTKVKGIQLGIAFGWNGDSNQEPFKVNDTCYFPIPKKKVRGKMRKLIFRWSPKVSFDENVEEYISIINQFGPDIIHIFGTENDFGMLVPKIRIPCVIHIQGSVVVYNHKWYSGLTKTDVLRHSNKFRLLKGHGLFHSHSLFKKEAKREQTIFENCQFFMGRTDWDRRLCFVLSPQAKYFHCEEMLREQFYLHQWKPKLSHEYTILSTIRGNIYKGLETVFESKKIIQQSLPKSIVKWKVAGIHDGDEIAYLIERKYKDKFRNNDIDLLGPLQTNELIAEMLKADLFIHPSHIDNSPNSICEAMMLGMPIITTYAGGIPSLIVNKKEGLMVQDGDPYSLAGAIIELINDRTYASNLGINARSIALLRHDKEKIIRDILKIYDSIIMNSSKSAAEMRSSLS